MLLPHWVGDPCLDRVLGRPKAGTRFLLHDAPLRQFAVLYQDLNALVEFSISISRHVHLSIRFC